MNTQLIPYQSHTADKELNVYMHEGSFWMTLSCVSRLFNSSTLEVYAALKDVIKGGAFDGLNINKRLEVTTVNKTRSVGNFYNLDIILAIGYKLNPKEAAEFFLWSQFMTKSYILQSAKIEYGIVGSLKKSFSKILSA
jgi:hypothetical protein